MSRNTRPRMKDGWEVVGPGGGGAQFSPVIRPHDADGQEYEDVLPQ